MSSRVDSLRDAFAEKPDDDSVFLALYRALLEERDLEALVEVYRARAAAVDPEQALYLYLTVAEVWSRRLGMPGLATEALFAAFELQQDSAELRERLRKHLESQHDWTMLARLLDLEARNATPGATRGKALLSFGHFLQEKLHDTSEAAKTYLAAATETPESHTAAVIALQRLRRQEPNSAEVTRALQNLLGQGPNPDDLIRALEEELTRIPTDDAPRRAEHLCQMARVYLEGLGDTATAETLLSEAWATNRGSAESVREILTPLIEASPESRLARRLLRELQTELGNLDDAKRLAEAELTSASDEERARILIDLARIHAQQGHSENAARCFVDAYHANPLLEPQIRPALRELFDAAPTNHRVRARLAELLEAESDGTALAELWTTVHTTSEDEADRAEALWQKGRIQVEQLHDPISALDTFIDAARMSDQRLAERLMFDVYELYEHKALRDRIVDTLRLLAPRADRWQLLGDALSRHAEEQNEPKTKGALLCELGEIIESRLNDTARALAAYRTAFRTNPEDRKTIAALRRVYHELGDHDQAGVLLDMELRLADSPGERASLNAERAALQSSRGDTEGAIAALADVLTFDESNVDALARTREILATDEGLALLDALEKPPVEGEPQKLTARLLRTIGASLADEGESSQLAGRLLFAALQRDPESFEQFEELIGLLKATDDPLLLADALGWRIRTSKDHPVRLATLRALEELAASQPDLVSLQNRLQRTRLEVEPSSDRFELLESTLESTENFEGLADLYLWAADHGPWVLRGGTAARIAMLKSAAHIEGDVLENPQRQSASLRRVLEFDRNDEQALAHFRETLADKPLSFYQILAPAAPSADTPSKRAERQSELAQLSQTAIGDVDRAVFHWNQVLGIEDVPQQYREQAFGALRDIYLARDRRQELMDLISDQVSATDDPRVQADFLWELVTLQREASHDLTGTRRTLLRILKLVPDESRALASLAELEHRTGNFDAAAEHLIRLSTVTEGEDQRRHRFRLARLYREQLQQWRRALEVLRSELADRPGNAKALRELGKLLLRPDAEADPGEVKSRVEAWLKVLDEQVTLADDDAVRLSLKLDRARVLSLHAAAFQDEAIQAWLAVLSEGNEGDGAAEAVQTLGKLYESLERWDEAASLYKGHAQHGSLAPAPKAELLIQLGVVLRDAKQDSHAAADAFEQALEALPSSGRAMDELLRTSRTLPQVRRLHVLQRLADTAAPEDRSLYLTEMAGVHEEGGDLQTAAQTLESIVEADPLDESSLERLQPLYRKLGATDKLAEVLGRLAGLCVDEDRKKTMVVEQARILEEDLGDVNAAIAAHDSLLQEFPRFALSLESVVRMQRALGNHTSALTALESWIRAVPERRYELLLKTAQIYGEELGRPDEAFARYRTCHELDPEQERPLLGMWRLAQHHDLWPDLIEVLEADAVEEEDPEKQVEQLMEVAQLIEEHLGDLHRSFHILRMAHQASPSAPQLIGELERVAETGGHWLDLTVVYRGLADVSEEREQQVKYLHRVADITASRLDNPEAAFDVLLEVLDEYPDDASTVERLEGLAEEHGLWASLRDFKLERAEADGVDKKAALLGAAALSVEHLEDWDTASQHLLQALELDPFDVDTLNRIAELPTTGEATWLQALELVRGQRFSDERQRADQALVAAEILETRLDDPGGAYDALLAALAHAPLDNQLLAVVTGQGQQLGRLVEAAAVLTRILDDTLDRTEALALLDRRAHLLEKAGDTAATLASLRRMLELDPNHPTAASRIKELALDAENAGELLRTLEMQAERLKDPKAQGTKYIEIAGILESLDRVVEAADWYERAIRRMSEHRSAHRALLRVCRRLERWDRAAEVGKALLKLELSPAEERADRLSLADLYADKLNDPDRAARVLQVLVSRDPDDSEAHARLETILTAKERWADLLKLYERRAAATSDDNERRRALLALAEVAIDRFHNMPKALLALEPLLAPDQPRDPDVMSRVVRLYGSMDRWHDAGEIQRQLVRSLSDPDQRAAALFELGELQEQRLELPMQALESWSELCDLLPDDPNPWLRTATSLMALDRPADAVSAWVEATGRQQAAGAAESWYRIGGVRRDTLNEEDGARLAFERALELDPGHRAAASALRALVTGGPHAEHILTVLDIEFEQATNAEERASVLWRKAQVLRDDLQRYQDAEDTLVEAVTLDADHYPVHRDLADLYFARGAWDEAADLYDRLANRAFKKRAGDDEMPFSADRLNYYEHVEDPDRLISLVRLGLCREKLGDAHGAMQAYNAVREDQKDHLAIQISLARCTYKTGNWGKARALLTEVANNDALLGRDLAQLNYYLGDILHGSQQLDDALVAFERALEVDGSYRPAADQRLSILIEQKRWDQTVSAFHDLLALTPDAEVRGAVNKRLGEVYEYFLDRPEDAIIAYEQAMVLGGDAFDVPERLLRLYVHGEHWEKARVLAEMLVAEQAEGSPGYVEYLIVLGDILGRGLDEPTIALEMYERAFQTDTSNLLALERIGRLHAELHDQDAMDDQYTAFLRDLAPSDVETRATVLSRYGDQLLELCDAPDAAVRVYQELRRIKPDEPRVLRRLATLYAHEAINDKRGELNQLRSLVRLGVANQADFQRIGDLYETMGEAFGRDAVRSLLHFIDGTDEPPASMKRLSNGMLSGPVYEKNIVDSYAAGPLGRLFVELTKLSRDVFRQELGDLKLSDLEELTGHKSTPAAGVFAELRGALDLPLRRLIASRDLDVPVVIVASEPPSIVVARETLDRLMGQELRFFLAYALTLTKPRFLLASSLGAFELLTFIQTLVGELSRSRTPPAKPSLVERDTQNRVRKFLRDLRSSHSVEVQSELESLVEAVLEAHNGEAPSARQYVASARSTAVRMGLLASGHQVAALKRVLKEHHAGKTLYRPQSFEAFTELLRDAPDLRALVHYIVSEDYITAQRTVGRTTGSSQLRPDVPEPLILETGAEPAPVPDILAPRAAPETLNTDFLGGWEDIAAEAVAALDEASEKSGLFQMPDLGLRAEDPRHKPKQRLGGKSGAFAAVAPVPGPRSKSGTKPVVRKPVQPKPMVREPVEPKPVAAKPVEPKPVAARSAEPAPIVTAPVEPESIDSSSAEPSNAASFDEPGNAASFDESSDAGGSKEPVSASRIDAPPPAKHDTQSFGDILSDVIELAENELSDMLTGDEFSFDSDIMAAPVLTADNPESDVYDQREDTDHGMPAASISKQSPRSTDLGSPGVRDTDLGSPTADEVATDPPLAQLMRPRGPRASLGGPPPNAATTSPSTISDVIELDDIEMFEVEPDPSHTPPPPPVVRPPTHPSQSAIPAAELLARPKGTRSKLLTVPGAKKAPLGANKPNVPRADDDG